MIDPILSAAMAFSLSQVLLSIILLARQHQSWSIQENLLFYFLISATGYLLFPTVDEHWLEEPVVVIQSLLPGTFWLFCSSLFDDRFRLRPWKIILIIAISVLPSIGTLLQANGYPASRFLFRIVPQTIEFVLLALALLVVVRFWRIDLVQVRRDLRLLFCIMISPYILTLVVMREVLFYEQAWLKYWQYLPVGLVCLITNVLLLQYKPGLMAKVIGEVPGKDNSNVNSPVPLSDNENSKSESVEVPQEIIDELDTLIRQEHIYREMGLTIGDLAEKLELPEYRLRKIINAGLGYRNFSDFLNGYRIQEAGERLKDPSWADETILNIALDIGFRSLSSFNKAFRERYEQTPREYRNTFLRKSEEA